MADDLTKGIRYRTSFNNLQVAIREATERKDAAGAEMLTNVWHDFVELYEYWKWGDGGKPEQDNVGEPLSGRDEDVRDTFGGWSDSES